MTDSAIDAWARANGYRRIPAYWADSGGDPTDDETIAREMNDALAEGTIAKCRFCGRAILLDLREGGGPAKDWGDGPRDWVGHGGIGMDYGCGDHPDTDEEGSAGHEPEADTLVPPPRQGYVDELDLTRRLRIYERLEAREIAKLYGAHVDDVLAVLNRDPNFYCVTDDPQRSFSLWTNN